jgi:hypothetical protein
MIIVRAGFSVCNIEKMKHFRIEEEEEEEKNAVAGVSAFRLRLGVAMGRVRGMLPWV